MFFRYCILTYAKTESEENVDPPLEVTKLGAEFTVEVEFVELEVVLSKIGAELFNLGAAFLIFSNATWLATTAACLASVVLSVTSCAPY